MAATAQNLNFSDVQEGGNFRPRRKPEGDYRAKIMKMDDHQPKDKAKAKGWVATIMVDGDGRSTYPFYLSPEPKQLWKIAALCRAVGINVVGKRVNFNPNKLVGKALGIFLEDDEFEGRLKSSIGDVFPIDQVGSAAEGAPDGDEVYDDEDVVEDDEPIEDEEPEPTPTPRKRAARKATPPPVEDEYEDDEEVEEEAPPVKPTRRRKPAPAPKPEPEDDEEYEDEEPEPTPPPRKRRTTPPTKAVAPARTARRKPAPVVEDDDLDDLDTDDLD